MAEGSAPQARLSEPRAILPAQEKSTAPEQPGTVMRMATVPQAHRIKISTTTPERVARAEPIAAVEAPSSISTSFDKQRATKDAAEPLVRVAAQPQAPQPQLEIETKQAEETRLRPQHDCEFLRQSFVDGTLVPNVDRIAYKRFLKCHRLKIDEKQQKPMRVAAKSPTQQTNQQNDGSTKGGNGRSGGSGRSGGRSNGHGKSKGN